MKKFIYVRTIACTSLHERYIVTHFVLIFRRLVYVCHMYIHIYVISEDTDGYYIQSDYILGLMFRIIANEILIISKQNKK